MTVQAICAHFSLNDDCVELVPMLASGDIIHDRPLAEIGGKALWTKELDRALIEGQIDIAVHSMKDVETIRPNTLCIGAMLPRADVRDRLIGAASIADLPLCAVVGTSSPRRAAQLRAIRPDIVTAPIRGNVATRLSKIESGECDATLLAAAGLDRLSQPETGHVIEISQMLPAASQGAIGIEMLSARDDLRQIISGISHEDTYNTVMAERAFLAALGGSCHSPVAALAVMEGEQIWLRAEILLEDGTERQPGEIRFAPSDQTAPHRLANTLYERASDALKSLFALC